MRVATVLPIVRARNKIFPLLDRKVHIPMNQYGRHPIYLREAQSAEMQPGDDEQDRTGGLQEAIEQSLRARNNNEVVQPTEQKTEEVEALVHTCQNIHICRPNASLFRNQARSQIWTSRRSQTHSYMQIATSAWMGVL